MHSLHRSTAPAREAFVRPRSGITVVELLVAAAIFLVFLGAAGSVFISSLRAQRVGEEQSLRIQETEAVIQLINYEVGLAGYRGTVDVQDFSDSGADTIRVTLGTSGSDRLRIRFFEDPDFLPASDDGEREVEYRVGDGELVRELVGSGTPEVLVGGVTSMKVVEFIGRDLQVVDAAVAEADPSTLPSEIAGVRITVEFDDGSSWTFLVGLYNRQQVTVVGEGV